MSPLFIFNNLNFADQMFGALVFTMTAWLAFDAYIVRKDFLTASRGLGFALLVLGQILGTFSFGVETYDYAAYVLRIVGLVLVAWNLLLEDPVDKQSFKALFILPSITTATIYFNFWEAILFLAVAFLSYKQFKKEDKKALLPFIYAFSFLAISALTSLFYTSGRYDAVWILGHIVEIIGFSALSIWVWQYLKLRVREMLLLIFFSASLLISIVVTLAFSMILIRQIELMVMNDLSANARLADYAILHMEEESLSKAKLFSSSAELRKSLGINDLGEVDKLVNTFMAQQNLGLVTVADRDGNVVVRSHQRVRKGDNIIAGKEERAVMDNGSFITIDSSLGEKFSIKAVSPVVAEGGSVVGYVIAGFILDNNFADSLKRVTGLDVSIYDKDRVVASTILGFDDSTRISGTYLSNSFIEDAVLKNGRSITINNDIVLKPFLSSYFAFSDSGRHVSGMMSLSKSQREILEIANTTNVLTLISVIIIMVILAVPIFAFSKRLLE